MICEYNIDNKIKKEVLESIKNSWKIEKNKIFLFKSNALKNEVRDFYQKIGDGIGNFKMLAEDVNLGDRNNQKSNEVWMEVRYDSSIKNAYRHSSNPQPLHTDGSYIPDFPNASIMCCISNKVSGGETVFMELDKLVDIVKQYDSELLDFLFKEEILHERSGYKNKKKILIKENKKLKINFNYFCVSKKNPKDFLVKIEKFFKFINTSEKIKNNLSTIKLNIGEAVLWKDSEILHGRNGFIAKNNSDRFLWKAAIDIFDK